MINKLFAFAFIALSLLFVSCSDDDDNGTNSNNSSTLKIGEMKAKINGQSWSSASALAIRAGGINIQISGGTMDASSSISITIDKENPGSYFDGNGFYSELDIQNPQNTKTYAASEIQYEIAKFGDNEIEGTFSFTGTLVNGTEEKVITEGKFRVSFVN